ncbi:YhcH/YjgK/YiaL family protein [Rasiella sp. SM2506]|uniref:YhcH/YjgK/YiaL family protein n=1 Tax=Rasiella sp. SM2506 TaxID=3423914 RepID=UPI003D796B94
MVLDTLENSTTYLGLHKKATAAFQFLKEKNLQELAEGTYEIDGKDCFAIVMSYTTKPKSEGFSEAHFNYIDIQYIISGAEKIGTAILKNQQPFEVNKEKDYAFFTCETEDFTLNEGSFAIFFPQDIHQTCIVVETPKPLKKVVFKLKID